MKTFRVSCGLIRQLPLWIGLTAAIVTYADQNLAGNVTVTGGTSTGNLNVTGSVDVDGPVVSFGTIGTSTVGNSLIFSDSTATSGTTGDTLTFSANRTTASWLWLHNASKSAMRLNSLHQLLLYQADGSTAGITLTPVSNQISFGTATLTGSGSTLTAGGALTVTGAFTASNGITNTNGTLTGGASGLSLNNGTSGTNITLSSSGAGDIVFNTNGVERARIKSSGSIGIGTPTPRTTLDIIGEISQTYGGANQFYQSAGNEYWRIYPAYSDGNFYLTRGAQNPGGGAQDLYRFNSNGTLDFLSGGLTTTGNVGIGTTNPVGKLHVVAGLKQEISTYLPTSASGISDFATGGVGWMFSRPADGAFAHAIYTYDSTGGAKNNLAISSRSDIVFTAGLSGPSGSPERMRISETGSVGIGTSTPRSRLDLGTDLGAAQGARFGDYLEINEREAINNASTIGWNAYIAANDGTFAPTYALGTGMVLAMSSGGTADLDFWAHNWAGSATPVNLTAFTHVMRLSTNGNVGLGTTNPQARLQLGSLSDGGGEATNHGDLLFSRQNTSLAATGGIEWKIAPDNYGAKIDTLSSGGANLVFGLRNNSTAWTESMRINPAGNVGIGTTNPTQKLSVAGTVRAYAVVVDTGWSDYVFDKDYRLAPLSEVEAHIKAEKHLPGIPSAAEVAEHGVSLGDMQSKLLAKVEELTLHLIEQEKQLKSQSLRIEQLERDNSALRSP